MSGLWANIRKHVKVLQVGLVPGFIFLGLIVGARVAGVLQLVEWHAFDLFLRLHPDEAPDERIVLIGIDEQDIRNAGQYPLSDQQLTDLLTTIQSYHPRVIGLDIYRDLPVEPGNSALTSTLQSLDNLIGIEKVLPPTIAAPPALSKAQVGIADALPDHDGRQRRLLLGTQTLSDTLSEFRFSFAVLVAQRYLEGEGILLMERAIRMQCNLEPLNSREFIPILAAM